MNAILIVDDDSDIRSIISYALSNAGFSTLEASNGVEGLTEARRHHPDVVILDVTMPEMDGLEVCRRLRRDSDVPIIFLSSCDSEVDRILGLEMGGDDYVTKPFSPRELVARVRAIMRRLKTRREPEAAQPESPITRGRIHLDPERFTVHVGDTELTLTVTEFGILKTLMAHPGRVFSRESLIQGAYREPVVVSDRTIDSHVNRIRRKFQELDFNPIETVHGLGYKLGET
ncbi:MAG: two-component system response regulator CreB [Myxococcales bacterium]|nr:two-component system response regulator CreB [Myxococcales bacterium]